MSVMTRSKRNDQAAAPASAEVPMPRTIHEAEAPDLGACDARREAPDSGRIKIAEAPDAGEGRAGLLEHEFTHGRSQS